MRTELGYQSGIERGDEARLRRHSIVRWLLIVLGVVAAVFVGLAIFIAWSVQHEDDRTVTVTITNSTSADVADAGFGSYWNERVITLGPVPAGRTKTVSVDYNVNECPTGFSYDQSGQVWRVPLDKNLSIDGGTYTITIAAAQVTVIAPSAQYVQVPTTQPIVFLDQTGQAIPIGPNSR